jgi:hypothetical protein
MSEEFNILNDQTEGGGEIPSSTVDQIKIVADNIVDVQTVADWLQGDVTKAPPIDGNLSTIQIHRATVDGWTNDDSVLAEGEIGWVTDADPIVMKIGDGINVFSALPNFINASTLTQAVLDAAVAACDASQADAEAAQAAAQGSADSADTSAISCAKSAITAQDWAIAPEGTDLGGGEVSAKVSAAKAASVAQATRYCDLDTNLTTAETVPAGRLFKRTSLLATAPIIVTVPPSLFQSPDAKEAWALYRLQNSAGPTQFVGQGGASGLQAATVLTRTMAFLRSQLPPVAAAKVASGTITLPVATTSAAKLNIQVIVSFNQVLTSITHSCTLDNGLTATTLLNLTGATPQNVMSPIVYEAALGVKASGTVIKYDISIAPQVNVIGVCARVIDGIGTGATLVQTSPIDGANLVAATATFTALPASYLVTTFAAKRGLVAASPFTGLSANLTLSASGDTAGQPEGDPTSAFRNESWATGSGVANTTGNFVAVANWGVNTGPPNIVCCAYPPATIAGAGAVTMHYQGGRDTLTEINAEAELWFAPNGKDVYVKIPKP